MKNIIYTKHLKDRLKKRKFPENYPKRIFHNPEEKYHDTITKSNIAIKTLPYGGKLKKIMIAYIETEFSVKIITIHPEKPREVKSRIKKGRYKKI